MVLLKKIILSIITGLTLALSTPLLTYASPLAYPTERISGLDRVETALSISKKGWDSAQTVILCEYSDYADSIASTPFAVSLNAPLLLTEGDSIDQRVVNELQRLKPQNVILLGGTGCLKPSIEKELDQLSIKWERIGGTDRYETSILLAQHIISDSLILVNGDDFPDALSAATFAGIKQIPIVLTSQILPVSVIQYYKETQPKHLIVIGGEGIIPSDELTKNKLTIETRLGGQDRYETNAKVVSFMKDNYESDDLFLASGKTFPDAVAGTVLASKVKAPLLLTEEEDIPSTIYSLMREHMIIEPPSKSTSDSDNKELKKGKISASGGLNLRDIPASTGKALMTIPEGTTIDLTDLQGQWYQTTYQSKTGWISADYVTVTLNKQPQQGKITASGGLNLRDIPASTGKALVTIAEGTTIDLTDLQGQWYQTTYQSKTGWISASYVTIISTNQPDSNSSNATSTDNVYSTTTIDLSLNGTVYILGGTGIISSNTQNIIEGKASSKYKDNLKDFPPLPSEIKKPDSPSRGGDIIDNNPAKEVLINPFQGIPANVLSGKTILVDPGHGGKDPGAIGPNNTYEKNNTLAIALALNDILKQAGAKVILTRNKDISPATNYSEIEDLQARVNLADKKNADLFISIHNDSFSNPDKQGTSTYFSEDNPKQNESIQLANCIQFSVTDTVNTINRGIKQANFYVLRNTTMPSILIEAAFISNPNEETRLQNPTFQKNVATAIFHGIYNYYKNPIPKA
ncbi:MAG: N-acetylmuramoyl-L-alanine amidase [Desulfitobacteriaceae bacterium]